MDRHGIRYYFEHKLLPEIFFQEKKKFVGLLIYKKDILFKVLSDIFEKEEVENSYSAEQFAVSTARLTDEVMMLKIGFPEPEEEPLCYCAYLFFDEEFEKASYFCIEKGNENDDYPFVCAWDQNGGHLNYGQCSMENQKAFNRCADIHMEREYGLTHKDN